MRTLLDEVEDFLRVHPEISGARFGQLAANDRAFVPDLRAGRQPREDKIKQVRTFIASYVLAAESRRRRAEAARQRLLALAEAMRASQQEEAEAV